LNQKASEKKKIGTKKGRNLGFLRNNPHFQQLREVVAELERNSGGAASQKGSAATFRLSIVLISVDCDIVLLFCICAKMVSSSLSTSVNWWAGLFVLKDIK
jgi:hypothetical protein